MTMDFRSQIELPMPAENLKSPIRKLEFDQHQNAELHIQNEGLLDQILVMTAFGPRLMTAKLQCSGGDELHYPCDCYLVYDDIPPQPQ